MRLVNSNNIVLTYDDLSAAEEVMCQYEAAVGTNDPVREAMYAIGRLGGADSPDDLVTWLRRWQTELPIGGPGLGGQVGWRWWAAAAAQGPAHGRWRLPALVFGFLNMFLSHHSPTFRPQDWSDVRLGNPDGEVVAAIAGSVLEAYQAIEDDEPLIGNKTAQLSASMVRFMAAMYVHQEVEKGTTTVPVHVFQLAALRTLTQRQHFPHGDVVAVVNRWCRSPSCRAGGALREDERSSQGRGTPRPPLHLLCRQWDRSAMSSRRGWCRPSPRLGG